MKINELKYSRVFNLGNYESETIAIGAAVDERENPTEVLQQLKEFVHTRGIAPVTAANEPAVEKEKEEPKPKKTKKVSTPEPEQMEMVETPKEEEKTEVKEKPKLKSKNTKYDRNLDIHKKLFSEILDKGIGAAWRTNAAKAKEVSTKVEGMDFMDAGGSVLPEFKEKVLALYKA